MPRCADHMHLLWWSIIIHTRKMFACLFSYVWFSIVIVVNIVYTYRSTLLYCAHDNERITPIAFVPSRPQNRPHSSHHNKGAKTLCLFVEDAKRAGTDVLMDCLHGMHVQLVANLRDRYASTDNANEMSVHMFTRMLIRNRICRKQRANND